MIFAAKSREANPGEAATVDGDDEQTAGQQVIGRDGCLWRILGRSMGVKTSRCCGGGTKCGGS
jgi:hypothetical protein